MSIKRQRAADAFTPAFRAAKRESASLTASRLRLAADAIEHRHEMAIQVDDADANAAIDYLLLSAAKSVEAHQAQLTAHAHLATLAGRLGLEVAFGDIDESRERRLRGSLERDAAMPPAKLAAVA